jgi:hypothetical protein
MPSSAPSITMTSAVTEYFVPEVVGPVEVLLA